MTDIQPTLFDGGSKYPRRAGFKEKGGTSQDAADHMEASGKAKTLRLRVYELFDSGWEGTADEAATALNFDRLAIRPRISELHRLGYLERSGTRHVNQSGLSAHVWRVRLMGERRAG